MNSVTGGVEFIGSHFVQKLLGRCKPVRVLVHPCASVDHLLLDRIELFRADIRDYAAMRDAMHGYDRGYHLAADPNLWRRDRG